MRFFTVSEAWGPFQCEVPGCSECEVFTIRLTDEENESLPEKTGPEAVRFIFDNHLGVAVCDAHRETPVEGESGIPETDGEEEPKA